MKIKNIAFYGVMASILAVGAARADDDNQIIASKAYVDAKVWANAANDGTLTVTQNGVSKGTFSANQSANGTIAISAPDWDAAPGEAGEILHKPTLFSGSYNDLTNTPTIPDAQVNSDWNASSGVAQILNKPDIVTSRAGNGDGIAATATASDSKLTSEKAVAEAIGAITFPTVDQTYDGTSANAQAGKAVKEAIDALNSTSTSGQTGTEAVVNVTQTNGVVTVKTGTITDAGLANNAVTTDKIKDKNVTFGKLADAAIVNSTAGIRRDGNAVDTKLTTEKAVADAIAANAITVDQTYNGTSTNAQSGTAVAGAISGKENSSNKSTTGLITAVDANDQITTISAGTDTAYASTSAISSDLTKVKNALAKKQGLLGGGTNGTLLTNSGTAGTVNSTTVVNSTTGLGTGGTNGTATDSNIPTEKAVADAIAANRITVDQTYDGTSTNAQSGTAVAGALGTLDYAGVDGETGRLGAVTNPEYEGKAVVAISQSDGIVSASLGTVGTKGIADSAVTSAKIANSAVTTDKINGGAVTFAKVDSGAVVDSSTGIAAVNSASDEKLPTEKAVAAAIKANSVTADYDSNETYTSGTIGYAIQNATMGVKKADGVSATQYSEGVVAANSLGKPIMKFDKNANNELVATLGEIKNVGVASDADIDYSKMNKALPNINTPSTAYVQGTTCTDSAPCVLSFNGTAYTWTNMDLAN